MVLIVLRIETIDACSKILGPIMLIQIKQVLQGWGRKKLAGTSRNIKESAIDQTDVTSNGHKAWTIICFAYVFLCSLAILIDLNKSLKRSLLSLSLFKHLHNANYFSIKEPYQSSFPSPSPTFLMNSVS